MLLSLNGQVLLEHRCAFARDSTATYSSNFEVSITDIPQLNI